MYFDQKTGLIITLRLSVGEGDDNVWDWESNIPLSAVLYTSSDGTNVVRKMLPDVFGFEELPSRAETLKFVEF